jgi:uncharacterized protein (DUF1800 family)
MPNKYAYIAMNRFTGGADKKSLELLVKLNTIKQAQTWLSNQLRPYNLPNINWSSQQAISGFYKYQDLKNSVNNAAIKQAQILQDPKNTMLVQGLDEDKIQNQKNKRKDLVTSARDLAQQTALAGINSEQPLQAHLLDFFSNHFSVSRSNLFMTTLAPTLEVEAIAPNLTETFADMLQAVIQHPAMLRYLNNERSTGPASIVGKRQRKNNKKKARGLNENLAREILELHTLGVGSGYTQKDVIELAKAITGWSIGSVKRKETAGFLFRKKTNEPGTRTLLGKIYKMPSNGNTQGLAILKDLAQHPATAKHLSTKIAKHFIADNPPADLVGAMEKTWIDTKGHLPSVIKTLIKHKDSWQQRAQKLKTPREFVISACKACGVAKPSPNLYNTLEILGHGLFNAGSPAGYPDDQKAWLGASALNSRIEWANHFASVMTKRRKSEAEPTDLAHFALGPLLSSDTLQYIKRAESKQQALALLLMSPDFQRR